jgi:hypothetical protein
MRRSAVHFAFFPCVSWESACPGWLRRGDRPRFEDRRSTAGKAHSTFLGSVFRTIVDLKKERKVVVLRMIVVMGNLQKRSSSR